MSSNVLRQNCDIDIIIRGSNKIPLARKLLRSIKLSVPKLALQLIYIDGGSDKEDLTQLMLDMQEVVYLSLPSNQGSVRALNLGLSQALMSNAKFILVLDNDCEIPKDAGDWLERWLAHFDRDDVGAVGAVSDHAAGMQQLPGPTQSALIADVPILDDFALMLRKEAVGKTGLFDERYEPGLCEDLDYLIRLHEKGWQARVATDVWIAHKGSETLSRFDVQELMNVNLGKLLEKWGKEKLLKFGLEVMEGKPVEPDKRKISLLVPTLNREDKLKAMLESVRPLVEADGGANIEVVVAPMENDGSDWVQIALANDGSVPGYPWMKVYPRPESERGAVAGFNWCYKHATGDILIVGGDDVKYDHPDFFQIAREEVSQLPEGEGMVDGRDGPIEAMVCMTRGFVEKHLGGVFMPGGYYSWYSNSEATARAMRANCHRVTDRAHVSSTNPIFDGSPKDATYLEGETHHNADRSLFIKRMADGFPDEAKA